MFTQDQKDLIIYKSQVWIAEEGYKLLQKEEYSEPCDHKYAEIFKALSFLQALEDDNISLTLTEKEQDYIYRCLQDSLNLQNYPVAGTPLQTAEEAVIIVGAQGPPGPAGAAGTNGTDATVDVVAGPGEDSIFVQETVISGVKTFVLTFNPYTEAAINVTLDESSIPDPDQFRVVQTGIIIPSLQVFVALTKGRDNVTASTFVAPGGLDAGYQSSLNLTTLNTVGSQNIVVIPNNVQATVTYTVNITDSLNLNTDSETVTFVHPFLYGNAASILTTTHYSALTRLVRTQANQAVLFNGTVQYFYFCYPATYPNLSTILDGSGFDVTGAFTLQNPISVTSTGLDANWTINYKVYRTTVATSIPSATYTFNF